MRLEGKEDSTTNGHSTHATNGNHKTRQSPQSSLANGSSTNGSSQPVVPRPTGPFFRHDREQVTRILIQGLSDLGYTRAAETLSQDSGYELENTAVTAFRNAVRSGDWPEAEALLFGSGGAKGTNGNNGGSVPGLPLAEGADRKQMLFIIRQQKYLELLERDDTATALHVLREEITPLRHERSKIPALSSLLFSPSIEDLRSRAEWDGADGESRHKLLSDLSSSIAPSVMIPEHRLAQIFDQFQRKQIEACLYHNTLDQPTLYHDHTCVQDDFPTEPFRELTDHSGEVWFIAFSPSGSLLATASSNNRIFIYETTHWQLKYQMIEAPSIGTDQTGICHLSWSPNERYLISSSLAKQVTLYDFDIGGKVLYTLDYFEHPVSTTLWMPDSNSFFVSSHDEKRALCEFKVGEMDPRRSILHPMDAGRRIYHFALSANGQRLAAITTDKMILIYDLGGREPKRIVEMRMDNFLTSITLSADGKRILVSLMDGPIYLLDAKTGTILQNYTGRSQSNFILRCGFGGADEDFVISGSEDSRVYIWQRHSGTQVACFDAHALDAKRTGPVNSVAWHPTNPGIFATSGDDKKVKIFMSATLLNAAASSLASQRSSRSAMAVDGDGDGDPQADPSWR